MQCRIADLRCKEVINICTGFRLGYVCDVLVDTQSGCLCAIVLPGDCGFLGLVPRSEDIVIPWDCIRRIGEDLIMVEVKGEYRREKRPHRKLF